MIGPVWDEFRDFWRNRFAGSRVHQNLYVWLQHHIIASTAQNLIEEREDRGPASDDGRGRDRAGPPRGSGGSGRGEARRPAAGEAQVRLVLHEAPAAEEAEVGPGGGELQRRTSASVDSGSGPVRSEARESTSSRRIESRVRLDSALQTKMGLGENRCL